MEHGSKYPFTVPICKSFTPKIFYDQLCYEVDVNKYLKQSVNKRNDVRIGLSLLLDTNENRQYKKRKIIYAKGDAEEDIGNGWLKLIKSLIVHFEVEKYYKPDEEEKIKIFIGTISKFFIRHTLSQNSLLQYLKDFMDMDLLG